MSAITLEIVQAKQADLATQHTQLAEMIKKLAEQAKPTTLAFDEFEIELFPGERYAGAVLDADGKLLHHLVLLASKPDAKLNWADAMAWAQRAGGSLPNRQEQALLFANCKPHLAGEWHWSSETHADDASYAWSCSFGDGFQGGSHKSYERSAVAVRRV